MAESALQIFWPDPLGPYQIDLGHLVKHFESARCPIDCVENVINNFPNYLSKREDELRFRSYLYILRDLLRQGWQPHVRQGQLYLQPPVWSDKVNTPELIEQHRASVRNSLDWERNSQFEQPSVRQFIRRMEHGIAFKNRNISIQDLIADGEALAAKLQAAVSLDESEQIEAIQKVIQPYLQQVESGKRCQITNFLLQDILEILPLHMAYPLQRNSRRTLKPGMPNAQFPLRCPLNFAA